MYGIYLKSIQKNRRTSTWNQLDLQTLGSEPKIMPKNRRDHCFMPPDWIMWYYWSICSTFLCRATCTTKGSDKISISLMGNSYYSLIHFTSLSMTASRFPRPLTSSPNTIQCMYVLSWYIVQHWSIINHNGCCVGMSYRESDQRFFIFLLEKKHSKVSMPWAWLLWATVAETGLGTL